MLESPSSIARSLVRLIESDKPKEATTMRTDSRVAQQASCNTPAEVAVRTITATPSV